MNQYILITVVGLEIITQKFDSFNAALDEMKSQYNDYKINSDACNISESDAWVDDGVNHDNYIWKIIAA